MGSIRARLETGTLFMDFKYQGKRLREQTTLSDNPINRKRLQKALDRIEIEIAMGSFDYAKTFGKPFPAPEDSVLQMDGNSAQPPSPLLPTTQAVGFNGVSVVTPTMSEFANQWYAENEITWRRSYRITQRGVLDKYVLPAFGGKSLGAITKADVLAFRADISKLPNRGEKATLSTRRINAIMKPLRQILNEAADRYNYMTAFRNIKPLKIKRSDVLPFSLDDVQLILRSVRNDFRNYFTVRFFTGMRTGEVHGLKWKYIDFERRLILVRESIVLGEEDELKTDGSHRDIQISQVVFEALQAQQQVTGGQSEYVFCNQAGKPIDNKNFINRVWSPLLRHLGLVHRRAYQMRHTAATLWLASGEAPEWIARQLGHTSTEMLFRVYSRFVPNLTRNDGSAMDRLLTSTFVGTQAPAQPLSPIRNRVVNGTSSQGEAVGRKPLHLSVVPRHGDDDMDMGEAAQPPPMPWLARSAATIRPGN
jgi:integrase